MRYTLLIAFFSLFIAVGCNKEEAKAPEKPAAKPSPTPTPASAAPKGTRGPNSDQQDILGKWNAKGAEVMQFEFTPSNLTIRKGTGLTDSKTVQYTIRNELSPSQIDWGTGADAGYGLYALDGNSLYIDYLTGGPENRPKKLGRPTSAKQLEFQRVK